MLVLEGNSNEAAHVIVNWLDEGVPQKTVAR